MEPIGEKAPLATRAILRLPGGDGRPASCAGPGEAACWPPGLGRVSGTALADEESERDSVHTGESHEGAEELHVELARLSTEQLLALVEENRSAPPPAGKDGAARGRWGADGRSKGAFAAPEVQLAGAAPARVPPGRLRGGGVERHSASL